MSEVAPPEPEATALKNKGGRPKLDYIAVTKAARARFDTLAAESIEAVFQAVLTAATQDGDMAAAKLLIDRVIPSRQGAPVSFHIRPLKTPEDCALAYADLLDDVGAGRLTPEEAQTISAIVAKRAELFPSIELAVEIEALKAQLATSRHSTPPSRLHRADQGGPGALRHARRREHRCRIPGGADGCYAGRRHGGRQAHHRSCDTLTPRGTSVVSHPAAEDARGLRPRLYRPARRCRLWSPYTGGGTNYFRYRRQACRAV